MDETAIRSLEDIWPLQAELNRKAGFDTRALGAALAAALDAADTPNETPEADAEAPAAEERLAAGRALKNYLDALAAECHELRDCLSWKHWYREAREGRQYELQDVQNARVEAADMLFFWVSVCQLLGLEPADVYRLCAAKLGINHRRQDEDRAQADHGRYENENRRVV